MCVVVAAVMSVVYIVFARFDKLSFSRRERYVRPVAELMKSMTEELDLQIAKLLDKIKKMRTSKTSLSSAVKVFLFSVAAVALILCSAVYLFFSVMRKLFFNLLIGWKGLNLGSLSIMFDKFIELAEKLTGALHIPSYVLRSLFYPFELFYKLAELFNIKNFYSLLTVTCEGAKSPIELFIDSFVLGVAILFIKSNYNFLWAVTFNEMNRLTVVRYWIQGKKILSVSFVIAAIAFVLSATNPFITMLRFFLSFVNFGAFFVNGHLTHSLSKACIGIEGFQNHEILLVDATSVLVWWLIPPMLYSTAEIVCPKGGFTKSKTTMESFCGGTQQASSVVDPLPTPDQMQNDDNVSGSSSSSIGSVVVSSYDDSDNASIDTCSIVISAYTSSNSNVSEHNRSLNETLSHIKDSNIDDSDDSSSHYSSIISDAVSIAISDCDAQRNTGKIIEEYGISNSNSLRCIDSGGLRLQSNDCLNSEEDSAVRNALQAVENVDSLRDPSSTADATYSGILGLCIYTWSYVSMIFSSDVAILCAINAYVVHCQKSLRLENLRQLRSHRRWGSHTIQQTIQRFQAERLKMTNWAQYLRFFEQYANTVREAGEVFAGRWYRVANESDDTQLPPYYRLCYIVQAELCESLRIVYTLRAVSIPISYFLAFSGIGHGLTAIGREYWLVVIRKYSLFFCACMGIWTDETYEAYEIEDLVRDFTISDPDEATLQFIPLTIASRVILLQALGDTTTLISIIVINLCAAPLFVFSPKLQKVIPPLIHLNSREVAMQREKTELIGRRNVNENQSDDHIIQMEEWVIMVRAASILLTESRLMVFLFNLVSLSLTVIILKGIDISSGNLTLLLIGMLPYYVGSTLIPILYVGKRLNVTDEDFRVVFLGWLIGIYDCFWFLSRICNYYFGRSQKVHTLIQGDHQLSLEIDPVVLGNSPHDSNSSTCVTTSAVVELPLIEIVISDAYSSPTGI